MYVLLKFHWFLERKKHWFVVPLVYAFTGWCMCLTGDQTRNYRDDTLATWLGPNYMLFCRGPTCIWILRYKLSSSSLYYPEKLEKTLAQKSKVLIIASCLSLSWKYLYVFMIKITADCGKFRIQVNLKWNC